jgi:thiol-disulfide isomerase/thioredoxin
MSVPGLAVVDLHEDWCGPCDAIRQAVVRLRDEAAASTGKAVRFIDLDITNCTGKAFERYGFWGETIGEPLKNGTKIDAAVRFHFPPRFRGIVEPLFLITMVRFARPSQPFISLE